MHIHILGIAGTFMGGLAQLAKSAGHSVSGCDAQIYPPMSDQLEAAGIGLIEGFDPEQLRARPDMVVVGNVMSRGRPLVEALLDSGLPYTSGPQWLFEHILRDRWVLALSGTHGKTTTSSILAWLLHEAGLEPGFLIGGVPRNFGVSARLGNDPFFVIEADEYDTAFFDKRSKFLHYRPQTLVINNIEYDHADIFPDLESIQRQFHQLVRTVPGSGLIVHPADDEHVANTLQQGCWSQTQSFSLQDGKGDWEIIAQSDNFAQFDLRQSGRTVATVDWPLIGEHNARNAVAALLAAQHAGVPVAQGAQSLSRFEGIKRRLEVRGEKNGVTVYDDFAHHPTAIQSTLEAMRKTVREERIIAVCEPRSNTMKLGVHKSLLGQSFAHADAVFLLQPDGLEWRLADLPMSVPCHIEQSVDALVAGLLEEARPGDHVIVMSNGSFGGLHDKLLESL